MKKILVLVMLMCSWCLAADFYVDPTKGNDAANNGESDSTAEKTITAAIADAAASGDASSTIHLMTGTYNDSTQNWQGLSTELPTKNLTFQPYPAGTAITLTQDVDNTTSWIRIAADRSGYTYTFNNLTLTSSKSGGLIFYWAANFGGLIVCNSCTLNTSITGQVVSGNTSIASYLTDRQMRFISCTISGATSAPLFYIGSSNQVLFQYCNITNSGTGTNYAIDCANIRGSVLIQHCTFSTNYGITITSFDNPRATVNILDNTFTSLWTSGNYAGQAIYTSSELASITDTVRGVAISNNTVLNYDKGLYIFSSDGVISNNLIRCTDPMVLWGCRGNKLLNNTLIADDGAATARSLVFGRKYYAWLDTDADAVKDTGESTWTDKASTTFDDTIFVEGSATDYVLTSVAVDRGMIAIASTANTASAVPQYFGLINAIDAASDTVTVDEWVTVSDYSIDADGPADGDYYAAVVVFGHQNTILYNILDSTIATNTMTFDFNPLSGNNIINYNCYVIGTNGYISNLGNANIATLANLQTKWQTWPNAYDICYYNDANSIVANPSYNNTTDYKPTNANLRMGSNTYMGSVRPVENKAWLRR